MKGLIQVYTGEGKGKTTAAIGLVCRACGHNLKVCYIYFHKEPKRWQYGEYKVLKKLGVKIYGFAEKHPHFYKGLKTDVVRKECIKALEFIKRIYQENKYDVLILDEMLIVVRDGFLKEDEAMEILNSKPKNLELVLTGRDATKKIIEKADLVSEIKKIKHPFDYRVKARAGVEY